MKKDRRAEWQYHCQKILIQKLNRILMKGFFQLARPANCAMAGIGVLLGCSIATSFDLPIEVIYAIIAAAIITIGGNALNDYFDREIDVIIHKERPIPSNRLFPKQVLAFASICFITGTAISTIINQFCFGIAVFNVATLILYEKYLKKEGLAGNVLISYLVASVFLFGGAVAGIEKITIVGILAILAFLANMGRELMKDVEDIIGDERERRTLPMKIGEKKTIITACSFLGIAIAFSPMPFILDVVGKGYLLVIVADLMFAHSIFSSFKDVGRASRNIKIGMVVALLSFLIGGMS